MVLPSPATRSPEDLSLEGVRRSGCGRALVRVGGELRRGGRRHLLHTGAGDLVDDGQRHCTGRGADDGVHLRAGGRRSGEAMFVDVSPESPTMDSTCASLTPPAALISLDCEVNTGELGRSEGRRARTRLRQQGADLQGAVPGGGRLLRTGQRRNPDEPESLLQPASARLASLPRPQATAE